MKIGKFVKTDKMFLDANDVQTCFVLTQTGLRVDNDKFCGKNVVFRELVANMTIKGIHNYWGTNDRDRQYTAVPRNITLYIDKDMGKIQTDENFVYVEGSEGTIQYTAKLVLYGSLRYKYQRGSSDTEIYNYYDYDTNLGTLLDRIISKYEEYKLRLTSSKIKFIK